MFFCECRVLLLMFDFQGFEIFGGFAYLSVVRIFAIGIFDKTRQTETITWY